MADLNLDMTNHTIAVNFNNRINMPGWWFEPTVGISHSHLVWDAAAQALGFVNGRESRIQAGARAGWSTKWGHTTVEPTLTGLAYVPIEVSGGSVAAVGAAATAPTDEGKLFGQFIGKLNFVWSNYFSGYVEGEVRGTEGVFGVAGRLGGRYTFNP